MSEVKQLPIGFVDLLDIDMNEKAVKQSAAPTTKNPLRPSAAGKCARAKAYEYGEYKGLLKFDKEVLTPETLRIFSLGHSVEYDILKHFKGIEALQVRYQQQVLTFQTLPDGEIQEGSIDAIFLHAKSRCIIDIKSKKEKYSNYYNSDWDDTSEKLDRLRSVKKITDTTFYAEDVEQFLLELNDPFFSQNFVQLNMYACHPFVKERGIDLAAIIQVNKNTSRLREVRFKPSQALYDKTLAKDANIARTMLETQDVTKVPKDFVLGSIACAFCQHRTNCWPQNDATKDYFRGLPDKKVWPKDTNRMPSAIGAKLDELLMEWAAIKATDARAKALEAQALKLMEEQEVWKVRLPNGEIYESKRLKNGIELRRGKL